MGMALGFTSWRQQHQFTSIIHKYYYDTKSVTGQCAFNSFSIEQHVLENEFFCREEFRRVLKEYGDVFSFGFIIRNLSNAQCAI